MNQISLKKAIKQAQRENEGIGLTSTSTNKGQNDQWFIHS